MSSQHGTEELRAAALSVQACQRVLSGCWLHQLLPEDAGRQSRVTLTVVEEFVQDRREQENLNLDLCMRRGAGFPKGTEQCHFICTEDLYYCTATSASTETHLSNVNRKQGSELIRASFHPIGYHASYVNYHSKTV